MMPEWPAVVLVMKEADRAASVKRELRAAGLRNLVLKVRCVNELSRLLRTREGRDIPHPIGFAIIESQLWRANFSRLNRVRKEGRAPLLPLMVLFESVAAYEHFEQAQPYLTCGLLAPFTPKDLIQALERLHRLWMLTGEPERCFPWGRHMVATPG
ncbi:hypothetical protein [Dyella sedimenti]|uniref:hypothetical protein n=1 Tax=Dyella sedimenti TaxID=2919947 RepID=UPI001FA9A04E|nr:hypothetical protein [Dyella sedimenti]